MDGARAALADLTTLDRAALEALIVAQQSELRAQQEKLHSRDSEIEHLKLVIAKPRRMMFGAKSEKVTREIEQLELKIEELETRQSEPPANTAAVPDAKGRPTRRPLPDHLPREVDTHLPPQDSCSECAGELRKLGKDVSEVMEYTPASFSHSPRAAEVELHEVRCDRRSSCTVVTDRARTLLGQGCCYIADRYLSGRHRDNPGDGLHDGGTGAGRGSLDARNQSSIRAGT